MVGSKGGGGQGGSRGLGVVGSRGSVILEVVGSRGW